MNTALNAIGAKQGASGNLTRETVLAAVARQNRLGREALLLLYGFAPVREYRLVFGGSASDDRWN